MDYIYAKLNNALVDINRIDEITLNKCEEEGVPLESLKLGDYYLKVTVVDSDKVSYCDLSDLTADNKSLNEKIEKEISDRILAVKAEEVRTNNMIDQLNQNVHSQLTQLNKILVDSINTINGGIEEERKIRAEADTTLQSNINKESQRVDNMINQVNENIKVIVNQLNENIASIVLTINTNLDNESKERLKQDNILDERITTEISNLSTTTSEQLTNLTNIVNKNKEDINNRVDTEVSTLNNTISVTKQELQTIIDKEIQDRKDAITTLSAQTTSSLSILTDRVAAEETRAISKENELDEKIETEISERTSDITEVKELINNETTRATGVETTLSNNISTLSSNISTVSSALVNEVQRATQAEETLQANLNTEEQERINADNNLSQRVDNLEGKTTRLFYGEGTLSSPTATEIKTFVDTQEVEPPYTAPYSGIAVVVYLTDEGTYHIWHYYSNLNSWKDDGVDLVSTFTNVTKGIIQGTTSAGYISAENGFGKVNGWEELNSTTSSNYTALNNKIDKEVSDRISAISSLSSTFTTSLNGEISRAQQAEETLATTISTSVSTINQTISTLCVNLTSSIEKETQRATAKENEIISSLSLETQARIDNDNTLSTTLTNSINSVNSTLSKAIEDEANRAKEVENTLSSNITSTLSTLNSHIANKSNPHEVTKEQIGLGNVDNTSDLDKPISTATQSAISSINTIISTISSDIQSIKDDLKAINDLVYEELGVI